ncbi:hypothetical protein M569_16604 [Genlisea aurea]|uniref:Uncharacterized protein n=1 Tax=Genlisea aurea TaxID=192259 RepID=S8C174_9LAMI|nr:hypothetical protein M569_16604 [Genlisea aurea]
MDVIGSASFKNFILCHPCVGVGHGIDCCRICVGPDKEWSRRCPFTFITRPVSSSRTSNTPYGNARTMVNGPIQRWGDSFNPYKAYQRLTGATGQWSKAKSVNKELTDTAMGYIQFLIAYNLTGRIRSFFIPTKFELWLLNNIKAGKKLNPATVAYHTIEMAKKRRSEVRKIGHVITNFAKRAGL